MAFDGYFCVAVAEELRSWTGAKVEKVHQSSPSCLCFCLYREGRRTNLILSASASRPLAAVTDEPFARPADPTPLCMLFRKHLQNGRLTDVSCVERERILCFRFESADELGFLRQKTVYAEMMGKYSNLILVGADGRILGATSTADLTASVRQVMPGLPYEPPAPQAKLDATQVTREQFVSLLGANGDMPLDKLLVAKFCAFSPAVAREICFRACGRTDALAREIPSERAVAAFEEVVGLVRRREFQPFAVYDGGKGVEYAYLPLTQYTGLELRRKNSFSELLLSYFAEKEETVNLQSYAADILKTVRTHLAREQRKLASQRQELADCSKREDLRKTGDLIMANLYRIEPGASRAVVTDYETGKDVTLTLDARKTPAQNAQACYKKYAKLKRAAEALAVQVELDERRIDHLESILDAVARATGLSDLAEIRRELAETGLTRQKEPDGRNGKKKKKREPLSKPLSFVTTDGMTVRVGRNNLQNDALTGAADKRDVWFHIKKFHGSHVILVTNGVEPTDRDYTEAAMLAAYHSEKRGSTNVEVDYTRVKHLRKPAGSPPGFVTYETYFSAVVDARDPFAKG